MPLQVIQTIEGDLEVAVVTSGDGTARKLGFFAQTGLAAANAGKFTVATLAEN
jgi:hypothetical protein